MLEIFPQFIIMNLKTHHFHFSLFKSKLNLAFTKLLYITAIIIIIIIIISIIIIIIIFKRLLIFINLFH